MRTSKLFAYMNNSICSKWSPDFYIHIGETSINRRKNCVHLPEVKSIIIVINLSDKKCKCCNLQWRKVVARCQRASSLVRIVEIRSLQSVCRQHCRGHRSVFVHFVDPFVAVDQLRVKCLTILCCFLREVRCVAQAEWSRRRCESIYT